MGTWAHICLENFIASTYANEKLLLLIDRAKYHFLNNHSMNLYLLFKSYFMALSRVSLLLFYFQ